jgi:hypothetical protein
VGRGVSLVAHEFGRPSLNALGSITRPCGPSYIYFYLFIIDSSDYRYSHSRATSRASRALTRHAHLSTRAHAPRSLIAPPSFLCDLRHPRVLSEISSHCPRSPRVPESPLLQCSSYLVFMVTVYVPSFSSYAHSYSIDSSLAHYILIPSRSSIGR